MFGCGGCCFCLLPICAGTIPRARARPRWRAQIFQFQVQSFHPRRIEFGPHRWQRCLRPLQQNRVITVLCKHVLAFHQKHWRNPCPFSNRLAAQFMFTFADSWGVLLGRVCVSARACARACAVPITACAAVVRAHLRARALYTHTVIVCCARACARICCARPWPLSARC